MRCGLPVVSTDCGGISEAVTDDVGGGLGSHVRTRYYDGGPFVRLARDPTLRTQMGKAGRVRILKDFKLEDQVDTIIAFYRPVLEE